VAPRRRELQRAVAPLHRQPRTGRTERSRDGRRDQRDELRRQRLTSLAASAGYERARRAFELGEQVRTLRETHGISQAELARRMGTTQPAIVRLEAGRVALRLETLDRVVSALDVILVVAF
jgi:ribosome-binding protein aMBF1 (putative translation factor)